MMVELGGSNAWAWLAFIVFAGVSLFPWRAGWIGTASFAGAVAAVAALAWAGGTDAGLFFPAAAMLVLVAAFNYAREKRPPSRAARAGLGALRAAALVCGALVLFDPSVLVEEEEEEGRAAVLVDLSGSMALGEGKMEKLCRLAELVRELPRASAYGFSRLRFALPEELEPSGPTDISRAIESALRLPGRTEAVVLVTDGRWNSGADPSRAARACVRRGGALFCVGVGPKEKAKDVAVEKVSAPEAVFVGEEFAVRFVLSSTSFAGRTVRAALSAEGRELASGHYALADGRGEHVLTARFRSPYEGELTVRAGAVEGDANPGNDARSVPIRAVRGRIRVLYIEGRPRWEYRYLKNLLLRDERLRATVLLASGPGFFKEGEGDLESFPQTEEELFRFDAVVWGDVDLQYVSRRDLRLLERFVLDEGGGFVMVAGRMAAPGSYGGTPLVEIIPVVADETVVSGKLGLTDDGRRSGLCALSADDEETSMLWEKLPQPTWCFACRKKPGATVLVRGGETAVVASQFYGSGTSVFIGADEFWRWRRSVEDAFFHRLYGQAIRFAARRHILGWRGRWSITTDRRSYVPRERVRFEVSPKGILTGETPEVQLLCPGGSTRALDVSEREGVFRGRLAADEAGGYSLSVVGDRARADFCVEEPNAESSDVSLDEMGLRALAVEGKGRYFEAEELLEGLGPLEDALEEKRRSVVVRRRERAWDRWWFVALFLGFLSAEWTARKLLRML